MKSSQILREVAQSVLNYADRGINIGCCNLLTDSPIRERAFYWFNKMNVEDCWRDEFWWPTTYNNAFKRVNALLHAANLAEQNGD